MKPLEPIAIHQLLSIIPNHPATRIMHISDGGEELCRAFQTFSANREYEYLLNIANETFYMQMVSLCGENALCHIKKINLEQRIYAPMAKLYDFVFVSATIPQESQNLFAKKIHIHIKGSGNLILFLPKNNPALV